MPDIDAPSRFARARVCADAGNAARLRAEFAGWLGRYFSLGAEGLNDVLLAVNEAIANAAEFAYVDFPRPGTLDLDAAYEAGSDTLAVTVTDHGRWRHKIPQPAGLPQLRGRGIPLMQALADDVAIDRTPHGTRVAMTWTQLNRRRSGP